MTTTYLPPIRRDYPDIFPAVFETFVQREEFANVKTFTDQSKTDAYKGNKANKLSND